MCCLELGSDSAWCVFGPRCSLCLENILKCWQFLEMKFVVLFLQDSHVMPCFHPILIKHQLLEVCWNTFGSDVLYFLYHGVLYVLLSFRHVVVRTSPNHRYTFTLRTHPSVVPGSIAFSLPQVTQILIYILLFLKVTEESVHLKQASSYKHVGI